MQVWLQNPALGLRALDVADGEESLLAFIRRHWDVLEPKRPFVEGWALEAICEHLQAITYGQISKLLINVSPGFMKSLTTDVYWPAWEWGPQRRSDLRYVAFSYSASLTERDNRRFRDLIISRSYRELWADRFKPRKIGETLVSNDHTGWKLATSIGGVGTGERGDRVILDDPHNVKESESDGVRRETVRWFRESMSNRLNDQEKSAVVVIMQRVHEEDVSGVIISEMGNEYEHLMIPMEWDERRYVTGIGWTDPRSKPNELAWPERFSRKTVDSLKTLMGPYATSAQYQQAPSPRGGGIFKRHWWQLWDEDTARLYGCLRKQMDPETGAPVIDPETGLQALKLVFPGCEYIVASLDTAYTEKQENDYSAMTIWGVFRDLQKLPRIILLHGWKDRLGFPELITKVAKSCKSFRINRLLIEAKANGISVAQQIRVLYGSEGWGVQLIDPGQLDKVARAYGVQHLFSDKMVYRPDREWAQMVEDSMATFPKGAERDITDSGTQALKHLRDIGLAVHGVEIANEIAEQSAYRSSNLKPLYPA